MRIKELPLRRNQNKFSRQKRTMKKDWKNQQGKNTLNRIKMQRKEFTERKTIVFKTEV